MHQGAIGFTADRLAALEKDVNHCLVQPFAPIPAIAYCFSTIDLLGALYRGNATKNAPTTQQSHDYMTHFMKYTNQEADLLQRIFRHKVIHLATPKSVVDYDSKRIGWMYHHHSRADHLKLTQFPATQTLQVVGALSVNYDWQFSVSIKDLQIDIENSVVGTNGYLDELQRDATLQRNFEKALSEIYDPLL